MSELERSVDAVVIGERERLVAELGGPQRELLGERSAVEEAVGRMTVELGVGRAHARMPPFSFVRVLRTTRALCRINLVGRWAGVPLLKGHPERRRSTLTRLCLLAIPLAAELVAKDDDVAARVEHDLEVAPAHRLLCPPAVDDAPLLPYCGHADAIDRRWNFVLDHDENGGRLVQSSFGTRNAPVSGMRDHGATSTTVQTASAPAEARA